MLKGETILSGVSVDENTSEFMVLRSAAGYYVGTMYKEEYGWVPNSRETGYFATKEEAEEALKSFQITNILPNQRF